MLSKFEIAGAGISVSLMALGFYLVHANTTLIEGAASPQAAAVAESGLIAVTGEEDTEQETKLKTSMVIDDVKIGEGDAVKNGDTVSVHYVGTLKDGAEFDNSHKRGAPLDFKVGAGQVIQGWEEGLVGMQVGGERVLVIPPEKAYGDQGIGPIPGGATLVFTVELVAIN